MFRSIITAAFASSLFLAASSASAFTANPACETSTDSTNVTDASPKFTYPGNALVSQNVENSDGAVYQNATECPAYFVVQYDNVKGQSFQPAGGLVGDLPTTEATCNNFYMNTQVFGYESGWKVIGTENALGSWDQELNVCLMDILPGTTSVVPYVSDSVYTAVRVGVQAYHSSLEIVGGKVHEELTYEEVSTSLTPAYVLSL